MLEEYKLEKQIWTDRDFDEMGWHDCIIHAISVGTSYKFLLDIDYIFKWIEPTEDYQYYKFLVSPCTLVFDDVHELKMEIDISEPFELEICDIERDISESMVKDVGNNNSLGYRWNIRTQQGDISFKSSGYKQYVRQKPILLDIQRIELETRMGISFDMGYNV